MSISRLSFGRTAAALALLVGSGLPLACVGDADESTSHVQEGELIAGCEGAKLDAKGYCRKPNGQFAKKVCCAATCEPLAAPSFTTEIVAGTNHTGQHPRVVVDAIGATHVVYYDFENDGSKLRYAKQDAAGAWVEETITTLPNGYAFDLAVDGSGNPFVVRFVGGTWSSSLGLFARDASGNWTQSVMIDGSSTSYPNGLSPSIAIGASGTVHVAYKRRYFDTTAGQFFEDIVYTSSRSDWAPVVVDTVEVEAKGPQVLVDSAENVRVAYVTYPGWEHSSDSGRVATLVDGAWDIVPGPATPAYALGPDGSVHASYCDESDTLVYAKLGVGGWQVETIEDAAGTLASRDVACHPALAVDKNGHAHVGFPVSDPPDSRGLWHAARRPSGWVVTPADRPNLGGHSVGNDIRIAVDASCPARAHIAHYDMVANDLRLTVAD